VQSIVLLGGLVVQSVTLCYLIKYVRATVGIQKAAVAQTQASQDLVKVGNDQIKVSQDLVKAANEQSEGLSKPVLSVACDPSTAEIPGYNLEILNIGNGPAIQVEVTVERHLTPSGHSKALQDVLCRRNLPYLRAGERFPLPVTRPEIDSNMVVGKTECSVTCSYKGVSEVRHLCTAQLAGTAVKDFKFRTLV
jgi:hypothetical protein